MDLSITAIGPGMHFNRGATAYAHGRGIDDHYMNPGAPAIKDWQRGWRFAEQQARAGVQARQLQLAAQRLAEVPQP
jgi:hypothetical protein